MTHPQDLWYEGQALTLKKRAYSENLEPGEYIVKQVMPDRIVIASADGRLSGLFPYHVLIYFGLQLPSGDQFNCPACGNSGGNVVHVDYLDENGRRAAKNVRRACEACMGNGFLTRNALLAFVAEDGRIEVVNSS